MLRAVDADTHIFESPQVWGFIDEQMYARRPIIVSAPRDTVYKRGSFWLIDGNIFPKSNARSTIEEYYTNSASPRRKDVLFQAWAHYLAFYKKRTLSIDCYELYQQHFGS